MPQHIAVNDQVVEFPDGMSMDEMAAAIKKNGLAIPSAAAAGAPKGSGPAMADPSSPALGGMDNVLSGIGMGMTNAFRGITNGFRSISPSYNLTADMLGLPNAADSAEAKKRDAPLAASSGGKFGSAVGMSAIAAPATLIPGANGYVGAGLTGSLFGAATEDGSPLDRAKAAMYGGAGGLAGKGVGDALGAAFSKLSANSAAKASAQNVSTAGRDAAVQTAQNAGLVLPPSDAKPGVINALLQGVSGKIKTAQTASQRNQPLVNDLVRGDFNLPRDQPLTSQSFVNVRSAAGRDYDAVGSQGMVGTTPAYDAALDKIVAPYVTAAKGFPNAKINPIVEDINSLRTSGFDADSGLKMVSGLRGQAEAAYAKGDKATGAAYKQAAGAIEDAIDGHLVASGAPGDLLQKFRDARVAIAKSYTAEKALNPITGDINAQTLGARVLNGKPLTGGMGTVGEVAAAFPKAMQPLKEVPNQVSPLDMAVATLGNGALLMARPAARGLILSKPYQRMMALPKPATPSTSLSLLDSFSNNTATRRALSLGGMGLLNLPGDQ